MASSKFQLLDVLNSDVKAVEAAEIFAIVEVVNLAQSSRAIRQLEN
jgi:hypothetical protein